MEYEYAVDITAPLGTVWNALTDVECWPEWTESMSRVKRLDHQPLSVGSRARVQQPRMQPMVWTVTDLEPERTFTWAAASAGLHITADHRLTTEAAVITSTHSVRVTGWLAPIVTRLAGARIRRYVRIEAEGLKRRCEVETHP